MKQESTVQIARAKALKMSEFSMREIRSRYDMEMRGFYNDYCSTWNNSHPKRTPNWLSRLFKKRQSPELPMDFKEYCMYVKDLADGEWLHLFGDDNTMFIVKMTWKYREHSKIIENIYKVSCSSQVEYLHLTFSDFLVLQKYDYVHD